MAFFVERVHADPLCVCVCVCVCVSQVGAVADVTLWALSSLALLPKTDPLSLLILGSRTQAVGAGSTLTDSWVRLPLYYIYRLLHIASLYI